MLHSLFSGSFSVSENTVHIVSLGCNPIPPPRYGGAELVVSNLCKGLKQLGIRVRCYSPGSIGISGIDHVQTLLVPETPFSHGGRPNSDAHMRRVAAGLSEHVCRGDIVLLNHEDHWRFLRRRTISSWAQIAHICEVAHWTTVCLRKNIIYPSEAVARLIGRPGVVVPHGIEFLEVQESVREDFLFYAGRVTRDKGVEIAASAAAKLGLPLMIAGPAPDRRLLEQICSMQHVRYLGELTYPELMGYYSKAKALVYMTQYVEPFGLSIVEAMSAGCPVITTGLGGTGETVLDGETGIVCRTERELVDRFPELLNIRDESCRRRAQGYSIQAMSEGYSRFFVSLNRSHG